VGSRTGQNWDFRSVGPTTLWKRPVCKQLHQAVDGGHTWQRSVAGTTHLNRRRAHCTHHRAAITGHGSRTVPRGQNKGEITGRGDEEEIRHRRGSQNHYQAGLVTSRQEWPQKLWHASCSENVARRKSRPGLSQLQHSVSRAPHSVGPLIC
jgi:hypothetical protein